MEKVLRTHPNVKKLYLLVRANDAISAKKRVEREVYRFYIINIKNLFIKEKNIAIFLYEFFTDKFQVVSKELFNVLREKYGSASFDSFFWSKVHVVQGDTTLENIGIRDVDLIEVLWREVDYIVNSAANTRFNERYVINIYI